MYIFSLQRKQVRLCVRILEEKLKNLAKKLEGQE